MPPKKVPITEYMYSDPQLPPGSHSKEIFGNLRIVMKQVHLFDNLENVYYNIKFWGQQGDGIKIKPQNSLGDYQTHEEYHFTVPIMGAHLYLNDMQQLQILLHDSVKIYGYININFARHLQKDLSRNTLFHQISGQYPIYKYPVQKDNEFKIGYQDIAIESDFISLESQLIICQRLKQQENSLHLQQLLNKSRNPPPKVKTPSVVTIFPTQKEQWMEQNVNDKLANVLFAKNPFENKPVQEQHYDQQKYETTSYKENLPANTVSRDQHGDGHSQYQNQKNQQETKSPKIEVYKEIKERHSRDASTSPLQNIQHKHEHAIDQSPPKTKFVQEPMRHPKVGGGHYDHTPTGQRFVKETTHIQTTHQQPQEKVKNVKNIEATPKKDTHNYYVQTEYLVQTRGIQSDNKLTINHSVQTESVVKAVPITEETIKDQYHTFNPTIYIAITKIQGIDNCAIKYKLPGISDQFECNILDHEMIVPFNYGSFLKSQHQPIIFEVHQDSFLGLTRIKINQIYETLKVDDNIQFNVFSGQYPLLICNEFSQIQTLRGQTIGYVHIQIAFGTPRQVYKLQQQSLFLKNQQQQQLMDQIQKDKQNLQELQKLNTLKEEQMINMQLAVQEEQQRFREQMRHQEELREQQSLIALLAEKKPESPKKVPMSDFGVQISLEEVPRIKYDSPHIEDTPPKVEVIEVEQSIIEPPVKRFNIHRFTIKLREVSNLQLQSPIGTEIIVSYSFPLCDFVVKSYPLMYSDQRSYAVPSEASYCYIQEYDEPFIDVVDNLDGGILFKLGSYSSCLLSSQELDLWMKKENFTRDKILIFNGIGAKLNISISYTRELITQREITEELLSEHNQTQQQIHLPKRVTLNLDATITINEKLLRFQDKTLDVTIQTVMQFKKSIPKLYGQKLVRFNEEANLAINDQILDILKLQPLVVEIKSNDIVLGKCELQQQCLLRDGIDGEYALINDKGIYAGFIKIRLTLERFKLPADIQLTMDTLKEVQQYQIPEDYNYSKIRSIINAI